MGRGCPGSTLHPISASLNAAVLYPGVALIEGTNVSVGRGTPGPFELVGAPWIDGPALAAYLERRGIAGVRFEPAVFTPNSDRYAGKRCQGIRIVLLDRAALDAPRLGIELAVALHRLHPSPLRCATCWPCSGRDQRLLRSRLMKIQPSSRGAGSRTSKPLKPKVPNTCSIDALPSRLKVMPMAWRGSL